MEKKEPKKHGFTPHGFKFPGKGLCIITILIASEKVLHKILESSSDFKSVVEMAFPFVSKVFFGRGQTQKSKIRQQNKMTNNKG